MNAPENPYEQDSILNEYLLFHYGDADLTLPEWARAVAPDSALGFPVRCVTETFDLKPFLDRALDLGCAVGRSTFELARHFNEVVGIDYSEKFIATAQRLKTEGALEFERKEEGGRVTHVRAEVPKEIGRERVTFQRGDAMHLPADLGTFDAVLLANLIDRLSNPAQCLNSLPEIVRPGGQLVIVSPYTWMEQYTPRENWLCHDGSTLDTLREILSPAFRFSSVVDLPFLIREHARKYQWSVAQGSTWVRR